MKNSRTLAQFLISRRSWMREICACGCLILTRKTLGFSLNQPPPHMPVCGSGQIGFQLTDDTRGKFLKPIVDVGLERQSFLDRGWNEAMLGKWNNGTSTDKRGIFLSMFYGLQMTNEAHPWKINANPFDYGLGAHIDFFARSLQKRFAMFAYDQPGAPNERGLVTGRKSTEYPFNDQRHKNAVGVAPGDKGEIYILTDLPSPFKWGLGWRMDEPGGKWDNGNYLLNLTQIISHEAGHCFGIGHFDSPESIMHSVHETGRNRWQKPDKLPDSIKDVAKRIFG